jgi:hypothetical protein
MSTAFKIFYREAGDPAGLSYALLVATAAFTAWYPRHLRRAH